MNNGSPPQLSSLALPGSRRGGHLISACLWTNPPHKFARAGPRRDTARRTGPALAWLTQSQRERRAVRSMLHLAVGCGQRSLRQERPISKAVGSQPTRPANDYEER
jgi:hypothetical protein